MRYSFISAAILAFASAVHAQTAPGFDVMSVPTKTLQTVTAGDSYTIKWDTNSTYADGTVSIKLLEGADAGTLNLAADFITTGILNSLQEYTWNIPADIKIFGLYGIQISWDNDPKIFQWSNPFKIVAGSGSSSASGQSSTASGSPTSTKTVVVSSNTAYSVSTTSSAKITSSASSNSTITTTASSSKFTAATNATLSTSASLTASKTSTSSSSSSTSSGAAAKSSSAAVANLAKGSFALFGGAVLAFVL